MRKLILASLLAGLCAAQSAQALTLELTPASQAGTVGSTFVYDVWVKGLGTEPLSGYEFTLGYNSSILSAGSAFNFTEKLNLGVADNSVKDFQVSAGSLYFLEFSMLTDAELAGQGSDFRLLSVSFNAIAQGVTALTLTPGIFSGHSELDQFGSPLPVALTVDQVGNASATIRDGGGQQNDVPEPSILALLGLGLAGVMASRRRKN